jgi:quercetin dioxygenase-like cupin family protein/DNA-binding XRE family transcriptional regulator
MDQDKKAASYESFREAAEEYGSERGHDLLTDPDALAEAKDTAERESTVSHGQKLRATRQERGFTLEELAATTGIDADVLAHLEAGETFLPLGQIIKLSKALALKMADFIATGEEPFTIVRSNQRRSFARFGESEQADHGYEYESLAPNKKDRAMEPFIVTLHPAAVDEPSSHDGQEFIYVLEGEMEVTVNDHRDVLKPGDAVYYDSTCTHLVKAKGDKPAKILAVLTS